MACTWKSARFSFYGGRSESCFVGKGTCTRRPNRSIVRAESSSVPKVSRKAFDGGIKDESELDLPTAGESAKGLVHRYLVYRQQNARRGTASTKTRSEVSGGGKKPFAQKGTGRARRGSSRSPLLRGGGVVFGPKPRDWSIKMNKKERRLAMSTALVSAAGSMVCVDDLEGKFDTRKTKTVVEALKRWGVGPEETALLITNDVHEDLMIAGRNIEKLTMCTASSLDIYQILYADKIVVEESALEYIRSFYGRNAPVEEESSANE